MKKILILGTALLTAACVHTDYSDLKTFNVVEGVNTCDTKQYVLAGSYEFQKNPSSKKITRREFVCLEPGMSAAGKETHSADYFKQMQETKGEKPTEMALFIPESHAQEFRYLYKK